MKKMFASFRLNETSRRIITYVIYAIFTLYTLVKLLEEPSLAGKVSYSILLLIILGIALWAEFLRILYYRMIRALSMDCDIEKAIMYYKRIQRYDVFKSYRHTLLIFDTLYYQDCNDPATCISIVNDFERIFRSSLDYLLIRNFTYFYSYYRLGNRTKVKKYYPQIMELKDKKIKGTKVSPLYNWEYISAIYYYCEKNYKKAVQTFGNVNCANMNHRELSQYYFDYGKAYMELKDRKNAVIMFTKASEISNQLCYGLEAKEMLRKLQG